MPIATLLRILDLRSNWSACLFCALVGAGLAILPHLATLARMGTLEYMADRDEVYYLAIGRVPFHGENVLRDPSTSAGEHLPVLYSWLQFVPLAKLTCWLGVPSILMSLLWRLVGGALLGGSLFLLFRRLVEGTRRPMAWALGLSLTCLGDAGFVQGRCLIENFDLLDHMCHGTTPLEKADALPQYRVVTPLLDLPFLLLLVAALLPSHAGSMTRRSGGVLCLGICFALYFYFWTAAVAALSAYLLTIVLYAWCSPPSRGSAFSQAKSGALVLAGGVLLGFPQVASNYRTFVRADYKVILERNSRGRHLPAGDPVRSQNLRNFWVWAKLAVGAAGILILRLPGFGLLWWLTFSGYALANSALLTGLEFENFHWAYVHAPLGEIMVLGMSAWLIDHFLPEGRGWPRLLWVLPISLMTVAALWRPYEALRAPAAARNSRILKELAVFRPALAGFGSDRVLAGPPETNIALLFFQGGQLYQFNETAHSSLLPDDVVHERHALNAWLQGMDVEQYKKTALTQRFAVGVSTEAKWERNAVVEARVKVFKNLEAGGAAALLARYHPDALLLPVAAPAPVRGGPWCLIERSSEWALWSKQPASGQECVDTRKKGSPTE